MAIATYPEIGNKSPGLALGQAVSGIENRN